MSRTKKLTLSAFFLTLGVVMPLLTSQIQTIGSMLLPMHFSVLLCGFVLGAPYGALIGFMTPLLRSTLFYTPSIFNAIIMSFELATYGFVCGYLYHKFTKKTINIYLTLLLSIFSGRIVWGLISFMLYSFTNQLFTFKIFMSGAIIHALPGIFLQFICIPLIVTVLEKVCGIHGK